jgi:hypothetical protein
MVDVADIALLNYTRLRKSNYLAFIIIQLVPGTSFKITLLFDIMLTREKWFEARSLPCLIGVDEPLINHHPAHYANAFIHPIPCQSLQDVIG